jgi:hypothetical protein
METLKTPEAGQASGGTYQNGQIDYSMTVQKPNSRPYARHIPGLEEIPPELSELPIWCAWKLKQKPGKKPDKVPVSAVDGSEKWSQEGFCTTAEHAIHYAESKPLLQGVGLILFREYGLAGGDADNCISETGEVAPHVAEIIQKADTYTEFSPGLSGFRFIARGTFGGHTGNNQGKGVEFYEDKRFLTFTGHHIEESPFAIENRDLAELGRQYFPDREPLENAPESVVKGDKMDSMRVLSLLSQILNDGEGVDYDTWQKTGAAIEHELGPHGFAVFDLWSRRSDKYDKDKTKSAYQSFGNYSNKPATGGSLHYIVQQQEKEAPTEWPPLVDLDTASPIPLPVNKWPPILRDYAQGASRETETPVELPAMLALGVLAVAGQRLADVNIRPGYFEPINLMIATALPPAMRKSAEFKRAIKPLLQWESEARKRLEPEVKLAESRLSMQKERIKQQRQAAAKEKDEHKAAALIEKITAMEAELPEVPSLPRVYTSDVTTEHLGTMMEHNNGELGLLSAEGGIFETMAGRYANGVPNIDLYLNGHAGDPVRIDRGSKGAVILDNPRLTIALAVQPDVLHSLSTKPGFKGRGLLGRFLYTLPPSNLGSRTGQGERMEPFTETSFNETVKALLSAGEDKQQRDVIKLSDKAREIWQQCWQDVEAEMGESGLFEHCRDWAGKLPGAVARMAALFHITRHGLDYVTSPVSADDMQAAVLTGEALASHALAVYGLMAADPDAEAAKVLIKWMKRHGLQEFTARDAFQNHKSRFDRADDVDQPLQILAERGYIRLIQPKQQGPGRPSKVYQVNPAVL